MGSKIGVTVGDCKLAAMCADPPRRKRLSLLGASSAGGAFGFAGAGEPSEFLGIGRGSRARVGECSDGSAPGWGAGAFASWLSVNEGQLGQSLGHCRQQVL